MIEIVIELTLKFHWIQNDEIIQIMIQINNKNNRIN